VVEESKPVPTAEQSLVKAGTVSQWLTENDFAHESLEPDHKGVEIIKVEPDFLLPIATALYAYGFNYLQCQCGIDLGPGQQLVSMYHLIKVSDNVDRPEEVRLRFSYHEKTPVYLLCIGYGRQQIGKSVSLTTCWALSTKDTRI
jgi:NAD(P)H-quinone oxidoreductase subunit J